MRNHKAIDEALSMCGFFVIGETDFKKTSAEILEIYRRRDVVEKSFDNLKNSLDMRRLYVQNRNTADGKLFCAFIALIVHSFMRNHLAEYMQTHKLTFERILLELKKSKQIFSPKYPFGSRLINPPSKTFRDIFLQCLGEVVC